MTEKPQRLTPDGYASLGRFAPTFYCILDEREDEWTDGGTTIELLTVEGERIARVKPEFKQRLDVEGSARLRDNRVVNLHEKAAGGWRYVVAVGAAFGLGVEGYQLVPYRTLAVDPQVIVIGSALFLPALEGVRLPSGEVHDGFAFAHDIGQSIRGHRVDVFVGFESDVDNTLTRSGRISNMEPTAIYQVDETTAAHLNQRFASQFRHDNQPAS